MHIPPLFLFLLEYFLFWKMQNVTLIMVKMENEDHDFVRYIKTKVPLASRHFFLDYSTLLHVDLFSRVWIGKSSVPCLYATDLAKSSEPGSVQCLFVFVFSIYSMMRIWQATNSYKRQVGLYYFTIKYFLCIIEIFIASSITTILIVWIISFIHSIFCL